MKINTDFENLIAQYNKELEGYCSILEKENKIIEKNIEGTYLI